VSVVFPTFNEFNFILDFASCKLMLCKDVSCTYPMAEVHIFFNNVGATSKFRVPEK